MKGFNYKKSVQALNLYAVLSGGILDKMKAVKLIWLADRLHLRRFGRTITGDVYFAMDNGPVASTTLDLINKYVELSDAEMAYSDEYLQKLPRYNYKSIKECNKKVFSQTDRDILHLVFEKYGGMTTKELVNYSHNFPEWKKYESALNSGFTSRAEMDVADFFCNVQESKNLFVDDIANIESMKELYFETMHYELALC